MRQDIVNPEISINSYGDTVSSHPAYLKISASRISSYPGINLYGSEFSHKNSIRIRFNTSEDHIDGSNVSSYSKKEIFECEMSESQWSSFISSMNMGEGVNCTLIHQKGEYAPSLPEAKSKNSEFVKEFSDTMKTSIEGMNKLETLIKDSGISNKKSNEMSLLIDVVKNNVECNIEYIIEKFGVHMESVKAKAKTEIDAYVSNIIRDKGLSSLQEFSKIS
jgi:hypothetical protein